MQSRKMHSKTILLLLKTYFITRKKITLCPMGQHMENAGTATRKSESGYSSTVTFYEAKSCNECPLKCLCHKAKENRRIEVNHKLNEYRKNARNLLTSEEGLYHRRRRPIEPEAVFGQTKANKQYYRFRHFDLELIKMDFGIFAVAFNIGKLWNYKEKSKKNDKNPAKNVLIMIFVFIPSKNSWLNQKFILRKERRTYHAA